MGNKAAKLPSPRSAVAEGKVRICVAGFTISHHTNRAGNLARLIASQYPNDYETWFYFDTKGYRSNILKMIVPMLSEEQKTRFSSHKSSPFCWLEHSDGTLDAKGGRDNLCEWASVTFPENKEIVALTATLPSLSEAWVLEDRGTAQQGETVNSSKI